MLFDVSNSGASLLPYMFALIIPFMDDSSQRIDLHVKQLNIINNLLPSELKDIVKRQDFIGFVHTFLNNHNRFKHATSKVAPLFCDLLFKAREFLRLEWPLLIDMLYLFAEFDPNHIQSYFESCLDCNPRLLSLLNRVSEECTRNDVHSEELQRLLRRLHSFSASITTPFDDGLLAELSSTFSDLKREEIIGLVERFEGKRDLITKHILSQNELLLDRDTKRLLNERTLVAVELMTDDDFEELDEQPGSISDIPLEWYSLNMVPNRFHPLISLVANQPNLLSRSERKSKQRLEMEKTMQMSPEQIEGWATMFKRNPRAAHIIDELKHKGMWIRNQ